VAEFVTMTPPHSKIENPKLTCEAQGSFVQVRWSVGTLQPRKNYAVRGVITEFSNRSRRRLLERCARLDLNSITRAKKCVFITLTYGQLFPDTDTAKKHLRAFLERIRRAYPQASAIWRLEYQKRAAPHFHLMLFELPFIPKEKITEAWGEIVGIEFWDTSHEKIREPMTRIEMIHNPRHVIAYVSKYIAKVEKADALSGFNVVPYLHAGRFWGVFNGENLPFAEVFIITLDSITDNMQSILFQYKRLMAKKWFRANKFGRLRGAAIFVNDARQWYDAFLWCLIEYSN
jgi:hypothetical protein